MNIYEHIIDASKNFEIKYELANEPNFSLKMVNHENPWSIKLSEFEYLKNFIIKNDIQKAYEVATAFGISTMALGLGLKLTGGKLVTMDAYIEETFNSAGAYVDIKKTVECADGYKSVKTLIDYFDLCDVVFPYVGWSPDNTTETIKNVFDDNLELFFIDAGHWDSALLLDINSILPHLNKERFVVFIHDTHCFSNDCIYQIEKIFDTKIKCVDECRYPEGFNLSYIQRGFDV